MTPTAAKSGNYFGQLDGLRFVAVSLVMVDHWLSDQVHIPIGYFGVNLFFVLSGFLITRILINSKRLDEKLNRSHGLSLRQFYIRRSLRIFPIYYFTICILALVGYSAVRDHLGWFLTYTPNIWMILHHTWFGAVDHLWSLAVEEQYYLFFPFLILFLPFRFFYRMLVVLIIFSILLRVVLFATGASWMVQFMLMPTCLDAFGMGGILAYLLVFKRERFEKISSNTVFFLISFGLYALNLYLMTVTTPARNVFTDIFDRFFTSIFCFFIIGKGVIGYEGIAKRFLEHPVSNYLGRISYGLYLFHNLVYNFYHTPPDFITVRAFNRLLRELPFLTEFGLVSLAKVVFFYAITVAVATFSWFLIEKPFNNLKDRFAYSPS
ncbi:acyltransferase family protein [Larkinella terrae]|uniref:Acyltransferase family protein n=1 Tax=Larkinella terrae TaxID=2025311 RepID=A0A7K0EPP9_9BACT|nr:acyltransferase [Larkinella terrae]MRS63712.1 acyltransferase family protein [Larkinella terrae]